VLVRDFKELGFSEEDGKRFHVTDKGITLVTPAMLGQFLHHLH